MISNQILKDSDDLENFVYISIYSLRYLGELGSNARESFMWLKLEISPIGS